MKTILLWLPLLGACASAGRPAAEQDLADRARAIHDRVLTIDTHDDIPFNFATPEMNPCQPTGRQVDIPKMKQGGLDVGFFIVFVGQGARTDSANARAKEQALTKFQAIHRMAEQLCPAEIELAYTPADVERIARTGKRVAVIGIENGYVIGRDLSLIRQYYDLGGRYMTLAHTSHNDIADSSNPEQPEHQGLSKFGEEVVREMNRVGMMVDVSHISKAAALHAIRISAAPVIASHSSTRALADVPRNMDDETLRALRKNGGVVQMVALDGYVKVPPPEKQDAISALRQSFGITGRAGIGSLPPEKRAAYNARMAEIEQKWPRANVQDFVNHIDHAVRIAGIDHVGISSDFDGGGGITGWNNAAETFQITLELVRRGYSEEQIAKLWGGNLLRVWRAVGAAARQHSR